MYQVSALAGFVKSEGGELIHVKPHGALYNQAAKERDLANAIAQWRKTFQSRINFGGWQGSLLIEAGIGVGLRVANEGFQNAATTRTDR